MKSRFAQWPWIAAALLLTSCASLLGPRNVEVPLARLQDTVATRFPFNNRYLELIDVRVTNPRVSLQPDANRIRLGTDIAIAPPFMKAWNGTLTISGQLKFDAARNALVLSEPRVEGFTILGLDSPYYAAKVSQISALLAEQLLKDVSLYTFRPDEFRYGGVNFIPTQIATRPNGLVVTFEPAR